MLKFIAFTGLGIAVIVAGILVYAAQKPDTFRVARAVSINASPETLFPLLNDLRQQASWSPFEKDPNMKRVHRGAPQGEGAVYEWDGNREVGAGRIAITRSTPEKITLALQMTRPLAANNVVEFALQPEAGATRVTWSMHGPQPFFAKVMSTFIDCEKMVGSQFEQGLARLKALAEERAARATTALAR